MRTCLDKEKKLISLVLKKLIKNELDYTNWLLFVAARSDVYYLKKLCHLLLDIAFSRRELDLTLDLLDLGIQAIEFVG